MKLVKTLCLAIALGGAGSLQAQTCSGGSHGGMDATGNQCNAPGDIGGAISKSAISVSSPPSRASPQAWQAAFPRRIALVEHRRSATPKPAARTRQ